LLLVKTIIVASPSTTKLKLDEHGPSPSPLSLNAVPNLCLIDLLMFGRQKNTLFGDGGRCNVGLAFINCHNFMPDGQNESSYLHGPERAPSSRPLELVVS
jgi:hypothetical protein